ncbi:MAG: glycosyltransferase [Rhodospirillaceae bacterium]|nr:glycosyltransferase [Rhodospirillaceae bacterium]MBT5676565.1 glycosyltransferase [Rhodospirillaceae bacterium]
MKAAGLSICHFSTADILGGSAKAAFRIHQGLGELGHRSRMLVRFKQSDDENIESVWPDGPARLWHRAAEIFAMRSGLQYLYVPSSRRAVRHRWVREADVIQLYNTHGGYLSPFAVAGFSRHAPVVWRLSDMWPATGHCAYSGPCERWQHGCGRCPDLAAYPPVRRDATALLWRLKKTAYEKSDITFVAPSSWMEKVVRKSPLLRNFPLERIATGVDRTQFNPQICTKERSASRAALDIPEDAIVILFAAHVLEENSRKGGQHLIAALNMLGRMPNTVLLLAGVGGETWSELQPFDTRLAGYREAPGEMAKVYAAADLSVVPSVDENLANTALEAMACGRPIIAFDAGGTRDAVQHMKTGYLAAAGDDRDLAEGIKLLVDSRERCAQMGKAASQLISREFCMNRQAERFSNLYQSVVARRRKSES